MLHVNSDGVQIQAAPPMEAHHLTLRRGRSEECPNFFSKRTVLPSACIKTQRLHDFMSLVIAYATIISRYAGDHFMRVLQFYLQNIQMKTVNRKPVSQGSMSAHLHEGSNLRPVDY